MYFRAAAQVFVSTTDRVTIERGIYEKAYCHSYDSFSYCCRFLR
jgi:hypothetical protein